jgi:large subunit ribosomal protein L6
MSRIGKLPITIPKNVNLILTENNIEIKGINGILNQQIPKEIRVEIKENHVHVIKAENTKSARQKHGLIRSLIKNLILGTTVKFQKKLKMIGVGYRAKIEGKILILRVGYSHPVLFTIPEDIKIIIEVNTNLTIFGSSKENVGRFTSKIRATRPPEPYNGKGICYVNEVILRKAGKSGKK